MSNLLTFLSSFFDTDIIHQGLLIYEKGGVMMIPLIICSFLVLLITLERVFVLRSPRLVSKKQLKHWEEWFKLGMPPSSRPKKKGRSIPASIFSEISEYLPLPEKRFQERVADLARKEKHRLERGLVLLDTIAGIAPLFGLLGTALGMVEVFSRLSIAGEAKMNALSAGISQALFTTVTGLCVGIPALIAYNLLSRHIEKILITTEEQINRIVDHHYHLMVSDN